MSITILPDLHDSHPTGRATHCHWTEAEGCSIVDHYGDPAAEHTGVRSSVGLIDRSHRGKLRISGKDRAPFLQGMVTNDIKALTEGQGCHAALLSVKGKMLADLKMYAQDDCFLVDTDAPRIGFLLETLDRYLIIEEVSLNDATQEYALFGLHGPRAEEALKSLCPGLPPICNDYQSTRQMIGEAEWIITRQSYTGEAGYDLYVPLGSALPAWESLFRAVEANGGRAFGHSALNSLRIEAGVPWYGVDMTEDTFPPEAHLDRTAISYTKGCYIGQETIARLKARGHCNRFLWGFKPETEVPPVSGSKVFHLGKEVGWITSSAYSPTLRQVLAMGYLRHEVISLNEPVEVEVGRGTVTAGTVDLPFYHRASP